MTHRATIFAFALLLAAPSYATDKITLGCVGTVKTGSGTTEDPGESLVIDLDQGIVTFHDKTVPILENRGNAILFEKEEPYHLITGSIDRVIGTAQINERFIIGDSWSSYVLTCKRTTPVF